MAHRGKIGAQGIGGDIGQRRRRAFGGEVGDDRMQGLQHLLALGLAQGHKADRCRHQIGGKGVQIKRDDVGFGQVEMPRGLTNRNRQRARRKIKPHERGGGAGEGCP